MAPNKYDIDLSNEVLKIDFGEGTAKKLKVKVEGRIKIADSAGFETDAPAPGGEPVDFFRPPTLTFDIFVVS